MRPMREETALSSVSVIEVYGSMAVEAAFGGAFMRRSFLMMGAWSTLAFLGMVASLHSQAEKGRTFAFLVACGDYEKTQLKPVHFTVDEMKLFRDVLVDSGIDE